MERPLKIFIAAGEVSSDRQAGHLARKLLERRGDAQLFGCGGGAMQAAGVDVRVETAQYGCIGVQESARFPNRFTGQWMISRRWSAPKSPIWPCWWIASISTDTLPRF